MGRVDQADQVAGMLYQSMLKTGSGPDERDAPLARGTDHLVDSLGVGIRAARADDHAVTRRGQQRIIDLTGRDDASDDPGPEPLIRMSDRVESRDAIGLGAREIDQHADHAAGHAVMVGPGPREHRAISRQAGATGMRQDVPT
jgi:hypothetical protein